MRYASWTHTNAQLRRELAYLYLAMKDKPKAIEQFELILSMNPKDAPDREQLNALRGFKTAERAIGGGSDPVTSKLPKGDKGLKSFAPPDTTMTPMIFFPTSVRARSKG